jgi:hypothetical protein
VRASTVTVTVDVTDRTLRIVVRDDGFGGADFTTGTGPVGIKDRVEGSAADLPRQPTPPARSGGHSAGELPLTHSNRDGVAARSSAPT